ncbi:MAG TPA: response regulator [Mariprofundaceae bacterium]|nr:response regulator [Mariprofundaceae bacterium]
MNTEPTVFIIDDDAVVRDVLAHAVEAGGYHVQTFANADAFIAACTAGHRGCIVLDVKMPGMDGPTLQRELLQRGIRLPIIFLSAYGDIPLTVRTIKAGAIDFLTKPVDTDVLLERIRMALEINSRFVEAMKRLENLTEREQEVLTLAVQGKANKEIARLLDISPRTVEVHRSHIMHKTGATSLLELVEIMQEIDKWN